MTSLSPRARRLTVISIALAALGYLAVSLWAGWEATLAAVRHAGPLAILQVMVLASLGYALRFLRWQHYLHRLHHRVPWPTSARIYLAGFALTATPGKLGELIRSPMLRAHGVPVAESVAAFLSERIADLLAILLLCAAVFWLYPQGAPWVAGSFTLVATALLLMQFPERLHQGAERVRRLSRRLADALGHLCDVVAGVRTCFRLGTLSAGLGIGLLAWGIEALAFHWLLEALGQPLALPLSTFIYAFAILVGALSMLPGGLGGSEAVMILLLVANGVPEPVAVSATLLFRIATLWFAVAIGAVALARGRTA